MEYTFHLLHFDSYTCELQYYIQIMIVMMYINPAEVSITQQSLASFL